MFSQYSTHKVKTTDKKYYSHDYAYVLSRHWTQITVGEV